MTQAIIVDSTDLRPRNPVRDAFAVIPTKCREGINGLSELQTEKGSGGTPCKDCLRLHRECFYPTVQRRKRKTPGGRSRDLHHTLPLSSVRGDQHLVGTHETGADQNLDLTLPSLLNPSIGLAPAEVGLFEDHQNATRLRHHENQVGSSHTTTAGVSDEQDARVQAGTNSFVRPSGIPEPSSIHFNASVPDSIRGRGDGQNFSESDGWEYHEPWSWTSVCSETGSEWIRSATGSRDFVAIAKRFTKDLVLKSPSDKNELSGTAQVEIDEATARDYVEAFYENCWEADLGIIDRNDLEAKLDSHYRIGMLRDDADWFALRNIIFAGGCRSVLARDPATSFAAAKTKASRFFQMAMSVFIKLLLPPSSLMAIQALTLMACYSESLGNPGCKHFLCSNAVHVAQSKGLHRQPDKAWGMSANATLKRNWLWWAIYTLDKHFALCSGRPSAIDDDNVSSHIATVIPAGSNIQLQLFTIGIRHAKIQSQVSRQLLSFKALSLSATELIQLIADFSSQLKHLLEEIPQEFRIGTLARPNHSMRRLIQILYAHLSIWGTLMAVHAHFFYPWMTSRFAIGEYGVSPAIETQISSSSETVAEAARKIILALRLVNTNVTTPSWLAFDYPIHAAINLFIYILKYPTLESATADLGLLDVCAGHFGYIEFLTSSKVSISLPREAANVASKVVKTAKGGNSEHRSTINTIRCDDHADNPRSQDAGFEDLNFDALENSATAVNDFGDFMTLDVSSWNLMSSFDMISSNAPDF